jgi:hypothetical protein
MLLPKYANALSELAEIFYDFLPGSGNVRWKGHITFATVASECGLANFWQGGSKKPAIVNLLSRTYEYSSGNFENLIIVIINRGISYRKNKSPITREDIEKINQTLLRLERKFPQLWDKNFLSSLQPDIKQNDITHTSSFRPDLNSYYDRFLALHNEEDRQKAGLQFESLLYDLFCYFELKPQKSFSVVGEQIDGSFELDNDLYLLEAKWHKDKTQEDDLLVFRGKIEGKSSITRGVFISVNGYTENAVQAICIGKQPNFFLIDGYDLSNLLSYNQNLLALLRFKRREMAEGNIYARFSE